MIVMRFLSALVCLVFGFQMTAQEQPAGGAQPRLQVTLSDAPFVVGQPITLQVKILVPTWMSKPPLYQNFEQPGLLVRLPEKSTHPISETVSGQTWSGTSRRYMIYPLEPARYRIPEQTISLTYADENAQPMQADLTIGPMEINAVLPDGARDMTAPVIVAMGFSLEQELAGTEQMAVGDTITRQVMAQIDGTTAVLIPALTPAAIETANDQDPNSLSAMRAYPKDPIVSESEDSGVLSGSRTEEVTYLAHSAGAVTLPSIEIDWFNLKTKTIETVRLAGIPVQIAPPPSPPFDHRQVIRLVLMGLLSLGLLAWLALKFRPKLQLGIVSLRNRWRGSERYARRAVKRAIRARDLTCLMNQLVLWRQHHPGINAQEMQSYNEALARLGQKYYGSNAAKSVGQTATQVEADQEWNGVARHFKILCVNAKKHPRHAAMALPEINP